MAGAFVYLTICSMRNRLRVKLTRLREPRYLAGLVVGVLYLYRFAFRNLFRSNPSGRNPGSLLSLAAHHPAAAQTIASLVLFALAAAVWLLPGFKPPLTFSRAEVQFLFQAPLSRRQLVQYKLIRTQAGALFGGAMMTLFLRPTSLASGWIFLTGAWLMFSTVTLHGMGISLSRESLARRPVAGFAWLWITVALAAGSVAVLGRALALDWRHLASLANPLDVFHDVEAVMSTGAAAVVLWPFRAIVRLPLAPTAAQFWAALPAALAIAAANYVWVLSADASFEEASAEQAEKIVTRLASQPAAPRVHPQGIPTPFALSLAGRPEMAILWKNLIMLGRYASLRTLIRFLPLVAVFWLMAQRPAGSGRLLTAAAIICLAGVVMTIVLGPQMARNDLRQDLGNLAVLKTWPLTGATLLRGELLAPMAMLTSIAWLLILGALALSSRIPLAGAVAVAVARSRLSFAAAAMLVAPALILAQLVVQNGLAIAFPAWIAIGASRARGIDAMGQRMIMMAGNLIVLVLSILPGAIVAAVVVFVVYFLTHTIIFVVPALTVALVIIAECWFAVEALGRLLDRTDVNAVDARE
jgi:ABC-2 type transport system permease protein